jgi:two-component system, NarL family, sensor histidine kinase UhpB
MWQRLSFRTQLFLPLGMSFVAALIMGGVLLQTFAIGQLADENEPGRQSTRMIAAALTNTLRASDNPRQALEAFVGSLDTSSNIQFRPAAAGAVSSSMDALRNPWRTPMVRRPPHHSGHGCSIPCADRWQARRRYRIPA